MYSHFGIGYEYSLFLMVALQGKVEVTISAGRIAWEHGQLKVKPGSGRYIKMPPFSYLFDGMDREDASYLSSLKAPVQRSREAS